MLLFDLLFELSAPCDIADKPLRADGFARVVIEKLHMHGDPDMRSVALLSLADQVCEVPLLLEPLKQR